MNKSSKFSSNMVKYIVEDSNDSSEFSGLNLNHDVRWAKFILTDDEPNGNNIRIPVKEFSNLIKTGTYMPIKVSEGEISDGHEGSIPIGVITHLKKVKHRIEGLAMLWSKERPEDVDMLKEKYEKGEPLDLSWEIEYSDSKTDAETKVKELYGTQLRAVTLVGIPAYGGRTAITAFASKTKEQEDSTLDELNEMKDKLATAEKENAKLVAKLETLTEQLDAAKTELSEASSTKDELEELRSYKQEIEAAKEKETKIKEIKDKFSEAGLEKDDEYFEKNMERFLSLSEDDFGFLVQEMVAFSENIETKQEETSSLPRIVGTGADKVSVKELAEYLKEKNKK